MHPTGTPDPEPPLPPCELVETWLAPSGCTCAVTVPPLAISTSCTLASWSTSNAAAYLHAIGGNSRSTAQTPLNPPNGICQTASLCYCRSNGVLIAQLVGNCCNCNITFNASVTVRANAQVTGSGAFTGSARGNGQVTFTAPCGSAAAIAIAAIPATSVNAGPVSVPSTANLACSVNACASALTVHSYVSVATDALASWGNSSCNAKASVTSTPGSINAIDTSTPCAPECP